jgi:Effector-associated domain 11
MKKTKFHKLLSKNKLLTLLNELLSLYPSSETVVLTSARYHAWQEAIHLQKYSDELLLREEAQIRLTLFFLITNLEE